MVSIRAGQGTGDLPGAKEGVEGGGEDVRGREGRREGAC